MKLFSFPILFFFSLTLYGQDRENAWYAAEVTLLDATELKGEANYNMCHQTQGDGVHHEFFKESIGTVHSFLILP